MRGYGTKLNSYAVSVALSARVVFHMTVPISITPNFRATKMAAPEDSWHLAEGDGIPGKLLFGMAKGTDGRWFCNRIELVGSRPLTTSELRKIPLTGIVEQFLKTRFDSSNQGGPVDEATGLREWYDGSPDDLVPRSGRELLDNYVINDTQSSSPHRVPKRGGPPPTDDELRQFAEVYRFALEEQPRRAMAATIEYLGDPQRKTQYKISRTTAYNYYHRAVAEGLLDSATQSGPATET